MILCITQSVAAGGGALYLLSAAAIVELKAHTVYRVRKLTVYAGRGAARLWFVEMQAEAMTIT